jgi:hypothetical protein
MSLTSEISRSNIRISTLENHLGANLQTFQQFFFDKYNNTNSPGNSPTTTYKVIFSNNYRSFQQKLLQNIKMAICPLEITLQIAF